MVSMVVALCVILAVLESCTPSPRYSVDRITTEKSSEEIPSKTTDTPSKKKPRPGTKLKGIASYYADDFHGKKTANGETFDMNGLTCAHKTLPFNTWLEVKNLANGRSVIVRVNDRGPFIAGRIIDLSLGAAKVIDMIGTGIQEVEIEVLP